MAKDRTLGLKLKAIDKMSKVIDHVQSKFPKLTRGIQRASAGARIFNSQTKQMRQIPRPFLLGRYPHQAQVPPQHF